MATATKPQQVAPQDQVNTRTLFDHDLFVRFQDEEIQAEHSTKEKATARKATAEAMYLHIVDALRQSQKAVQVGSAERQRIETRVDGLKLAELLLPYVSGILLDGAKSAEKKAVSLGMSVYRNGAKSRAARAGHDVSTPPAVRAAVRHLDRHLGIESKIYWPPALREPPAGLLEFLRQIDQF